MHHEAHFPDCAGGEKCRCETRRYLRALAVVASICLFELIYAYTTNGLVLVEDAGHAASDSANLMILIVISSIVRMRRSNEHRLRMLGLWISVALLGAAVIWVLIEARERLVNPPEVEGIGIAIVAFIAFLGNCWQMKILEPGVWHATHKSVWVHALADAGISLTAACSGFIVWMTDDYAWDLYFALFLAGVLVTLAVWLVCNRDDHPHAH